MDRKWECDVLVAHFAELDENNIVIRVIVVNNNELLDENGNELESKGIQFCQSIFNGNWIQTSYNANFRKNYAGIGFFYDETKDAFIPIKPFSSWILNEETCNWQPPIPQPEPIENFIWLWDEETTSWVSEAINN